jgi:hypothetical protein
LTEIEKALQELKCKHVMFDALAKCQMLEAGLKELLATKYQVIHSLVKDTVYLRIEHKTTSEHFNEYSLERLIKELKNVTGNKDFIKHLDSIKIKRNELAHAAFMKLANKQYAADTLTKIAELNLFDSKLDEAFEYILAETAETISQSSRVLTIKANNKK